MISRNQGLKLVVNAIFSTIPAMMNVLLVCSVFLLIFAVLGIHFFKGTFFHCQGAAHLDSVVTRADCIDDGGVWLNKRSNFDGIWESTLTLFEMMTAEGWMEVMYSGVDSVGVGLQPKREAQAGWAFYFIGFIIVGHMFILNLFVGVVIDNFNHMKEQLGGYILLSEE